MLLKSIRLIVAIIFLVPPFKANAIVATVKGYVASVHEASGLDFSGGSSYWTHNDGYGDNRLYKLSSTGSLSRIVTVSNATNVDWEDLASDNQKVNMYIGDFGNNSCSRTNLRIYKIPHPSSNSSSTATASVIRFSYPDQTRFPSKWLNFDVEGFFHLNGKLYLFTKADGNAVGYCKLYTLPDQPGTYTATFIDSFPISSRITGADISPDGRTAVLISNTRIYLFENFSGSNIFNGTYTKINIDGSYTQKEGVCFNSSNSICLIDEGSSNKLYSVSLSSYMRLSTEPDQAEIKLEQSALLSDNIFPNPATEFFTVRNPGNFEQADILITDITGKVLNRFPMTKMDAEIRVNTTQLAAGIYFVQMIAEGNRRETARVIMN